MNDWLNQLQNSSAFPPAMTAVKLSVALAIGLIGFERQWSHKDFGVRTFSLTSMLGALTGLMSAPILLIGMSATVLLAVLLNVRDIVKSKAVEGTTSVPLLVTFVLGALVGTGHMFTSVACAIITTWLLSLKRQFKQFAGGVTAQEIRSAVMLGLFGFVIWPLLPNRYIAGRLPIFRWKRVSLGLKLLEEILFLAFRVVSSRPRPRLRKTKATWSIIFC